MTTLDGWSWPPGLPAPSSFARTQAGGLEIRYPKSDHHLAYVVASSLRHAARALATMRTGDLVAALGAVGERFARDLDDQGVREVAANAGLSPAMAQAVVTGMVESWTTEALERLVQAEFPDPGVLDGFVAEDGRRIRAAAPGVTLHFGAGSVPGVTVTSMIRALLVKSAVLVKPGAGDVALTVRFARALRHADPLLGAAVAVQYWPGGATASDGWERAALHAADQVVVYGGDAAIEAIRARAPAATRLIEHPHRIGVAVVDPGSARNAAEQTARAVALFDQKGCVSTHLVLLVDASEGAQRWCGELAGRLAEIDAALPPAPPPAGELSALHQLRGRLAMKTAASGGIELWVSKGAGWTVALAGPEAFEPHGGRMAWVVPVAGRSGCLEVLAKLSPVLQTVGLAGIRTGRTAFAEELVALGATRIVPLEQVPFPEPEWLHDGSRPLGELVRWAELR